MINNRHRWQDRVGILVIIILTIIMMTTISVIIITTIMIAFDLTIIFKTQEIVDFVKQLCAALGQLIPGFEVDDSLFC